MHNTLSQLKNDLAAGSVVASRGIKDTLSGHSPPEEENIEVETVVLVGGELENKGAQAMVFTTVNELRKRFSDCRIALLSHCDYNKPQAVRDRYAFEILPWTPEVKFSMLAQGHEKYTEHARTASVVTEADLFIDISGYSLSSLSGFRVSANYILDIMVASKVGAAYYILPQSIGPFSYNRWERLIITPLLRQYLPYPNAIYTRELEGVQSLTPYTRENVTMSHDIVLREGSYDLETVFSKKPDLDVPEIQEGAVGLVPNTRLLSVFERDRLLELYRKQVASLERPIYILAHSSSDKVFCKEVAKRVQDDAILVEGDRNAPELEQIIAQFDFLIGSRYHSIVHAYKHGVPCLILGWASKYSELADKFEQTTFHFDARERINDDAVVSTTTLLSESVEEQSEIISSRLSCLSQRDVFTREFGPRGK